MIVAACIISLVYYCLSVLVRGSILSPDGTAYYNIRTAPLPYKARMLAYVVTGENAWRFVHCLSFALASTALFSAFGLSAMLLWMVLPSVRTSLAWPVLLDLPMQATSFASVAFVLAGWEYVGLALLALSVLVHERTPIYTALMLWFFTGSILPLAIGACAFALWFTLVYQWMPKQQTGIDYLDRPLKTSMQHHLPTLLNASVWLLPWGACLFAIAAADWRLAAYAVASYAACMVAMDRVRIYQAFPLPFIVAALSVIPQAFIPLAIIGTFSFNTREI